MANQNNQLKPLTTLTFPGSITGKGSVTREKWASLSDDIIFEAKHSPVDMNYKPNLANFVQQDLIQGKPRLQRLGTNLQQIKIVCKFHFMVKPYKDLQAKLSDAALNGTVLQWIWGTGEVVGDFIIKDWEEKPKKTDEIGLIFATEIELTLLEYAGPGVAEQTGIDAKKQAFANKKKEDLNANLPTMGISSIQSLSKASAVIKVQNAKIQAKLSALVKLKKSLAAFKREVIPCIQKMKQAVNAINTAVNIGRNIKNANSISAAASLCGTAVNSLGSAVGGNTTVSAIGGLCNDVSLGAGAVDNATQASNTVKSWFAPLGF